MALWRLGRLCEEFGCTPMVMQAELERDPEQMAVQIAELRWYARAKAVVDAAKADTDLPRGDPFVQRVIQTQAQLLREGR